MAKAEFLCFLFLFFLLLQGSNAAYNVVDFGAKPDGRTDSTKPFLRAWSAACNTAATRQGATSVYVPRGSFMVKPIVFSGPCRNKVAFLIDGTIVAPSNYWNLGTSGYWISFSKVSRVTIYGGNLDAKGAAFWACRKAGKVCPPGARSISFVGCRNVMVRGLTSSNSQLFHIVIDQSRDIVLDNIKIRAPTWSLNTDGIHVQSSTGITITGSTIQTGDDCISIGPGTKDVWIERIGCGPGHGISVGSLAEQKNEAGVQNVTVTGAVFTGTLNGVRIKSWARPSTGFARNIVFQNIIMRNASNPVIIDQNYCPTGQGCPNQNSGVKISGVTYSNIKGTSASQVATNFICSPSNPCTGLKLQDIKLTYHGRNGSSARSSCSHAHGTTSGIVIPPSCL